ncbi:hypothetical protein [Hymenobacter cavernae]|uniref:Uncharacterized protein n=1 Tax=Hymenobacter cavernae TaxID=2044852 RepID=A0ABQ1U396_9BACT|nr:hypothetical protein [Hymenobacter cavernae]GGF09614.1 hypothetical protein GCM10011383_21020 [Hymenobacter cavernae]
MGFTIDNRRFGLVLASDVNPRDGLGWQLWEYTNRKSVLLLEIFRHDDLKKISFETFEPMDIPYEALEIVLNDFNTTGGRNFIVDPEEDSEETT